MGLVLGLLGACAAPRAAPEPTPAVSEIVVCGQRIPVAAPLVLWQNAPFYDAYRIEPRFSSEGPDGLRYRPGRETDDVRLAERVEMEGWTLENLQRQVDLLVLHYDVAGTSRRCFRILHDMRELSVHFLLDVDGTIYQTLDLREQAWHARQANPRSIGIEIANIGAYPVGEANPLGEWYSTDGGGVVLTLPASLGDGGVRTPDFRGRPARPDRIRGKVHGALYEQHDFTPEQYDSLVALTVALMQAFPRMELRVPRDAAGAVRMDALSAEEFQRFHGILGHHHLSKTKRDPGPAFDWEGYLRRVGRSVP